MSILLAIFVDNLLPVFFVIGTGFALGMTLRPEVKPISRLTFYTLTPCLIFSGLVESPLTGSETQQVMAFAILATLAAALVAWLVGTLLRWQGPRRRALLLSVLVINAGNFGLSVVLLSFGEQAQALAMIYFVTTAVLSSTVGVAIAAGGSTLRQVLSNLLSIPLLYAALGAVVVGLLKLKVPELLMRPISLMGRAAVPMMLLILGLQLSKSLHVIRGNAPAIALATGLRLLVAPLLALPVAWLIGVKGLAFQACMLEASMPAGVTGTVLALEYDLEPELVTGVVFVSTVFSALTLSVLISLIR